MEMLRRARAGQEPLWRVWWLIGVPLWLCLSVLQTWVTSRLVDDPRGSMDLVLAEVVIILVLWFPWLVAVWRCSRNVRHPFWGYAARVLLVTLPAINASLSREYQNEIGDRIVAGIAATENRSPGTAPSRADLDEAWLASDNDQLARDGRSGQNGSGGPNIASASGLTAWSNGAGAMAYLDSNWQKTAPPEQPLPETTYLHYMGHGDIALVGATRTHLALDVFGEGMARELGGYEIASNAKSLTLEGQNLWLIGLRPADQQASEYGLLYVFRDRRGNVWHIFTAGRSTEDGFVARANSLAAAFVKAAFGG